MLTNNELQTIMQAMQIAADRYPDVGYCSDRAFMIRQLIGAGEVMTFSERGVSLIHTKDLDKVLMCSREIKIPFHPNVYRNIVNWVYHTVYVYKNTVFTYEIEHWRMSLNQYRKVLNASNGYMVRARNEKISLYNPNATYCG